MSSEWYYTTNKQQMGPVSWEELRELASGGILKPHDLVWADGMDEWVKAINQSGLFTDEEAEEEKITAKKSSHSKTKPPPGRRRRVQEEEEEDEEDEKEEKRKSRKRKQQRTEMAVGMKIGLIVAGVLGVLLLLSCAGGAIVFVALGGLGGGGGPVNANYTIANLQQGREDSRRFNFQQGRRVVITVVNNLANPNTDVDLYVHRNNDQLPLVADIRIPIQDRNCRVEFIPPATDSYVVHVVNLGPGNANSCAVTVEQR